MAEKEMTAEGIRQMMFGHMFRVEDINIPTFPELDGHLQLKALSATAINSALQFKETMDQSAFMVIRSLVYKETKEQVFKDSDRESLLTEMEAAMLDYVVVRIRAFNTITEERIVDAKKDSKSDPSTDTSTSSQAE